ncbi:mechanosensitive ion channel family protein [Umboniibacter marinipuniceus]|uniref:Small-conductance mechanosensitive channel n=1 Tax=Umboniibacter marinipuniceus TaxID=569599 RepID=A0A3M0ADC0_9GAMM|nr:mechanosensitive ion channel domain-containing protein [Umboniibacter marinipuniceus]RMA82507.1 small conductance mechanosensitive channel [Umboniibacter marinipuniceus]
MEMTEAEVIVADVTTWFQDYHELIVEIGLKALFALLIFLIGTYVAGVVRRQTDKRLKSRGVDPAVSGFVAKIIQITIVGAVLVATLNEIGVETTSLVAVLGAAGLAIGLALKDSLSNFSSGVMIIVLKPFRSGDFIEASGIVGVVKTIELFSTKLVTPDNKVIILPNSTVYASEITNYSALPTRRVDIVVGISYESDMRDAKSVIMTALKANDFVLNEPEPVVAVSELADSSVNLVVRPWVNTADYWMARFAIIEDVKRALDDNDITIPFPQMDVHFDKG